MKRAVIDPDEGIRGSAASLVPAGPAGSVDVRSPGDWSADQAAMGFLLGYAGRTRDAYTTDLRGWFDFLDGIGVRPFAAGRVHVDAWARNLAEVEDRSPATVARRLSTVSGYYRWCLNEGLIERNPVAAVRRPKVGSDSVSTGLSREELSALIVAAAKDGPRTHALVLLLAFNGLRISEALTARVEDLGEERGHRVLRITRKGGKRALVPLAPRTAVALDRYLDGRTNGPLFETATGRPMDRPAAWRLLRRLARSTLPGKAESLHPHDLRHSFVTLSLDAGASLRDVQDAAGHADPRTTRRYDRARHNLDRHPTYALAGLVE